MTIAWVFPGQGSQEVGMGKAVAEASAAAREVYRRADAALGEDLSKLCFAGPLETLTLTANTQPAIVATSLALLAALREAVPALPPPAFALGHSLGEWSALAAAGALDLETAIRLTRLRGRAMQEAVPAGVGAMAAIMGLDPAAVAAICAEAAEGEVVSPANFNAPGQIVVAGHAGAVGRVRERVAGRGGKAIALQVSAPFHCALMQPAAERLAAALADAPIAPSAFPVVANVDGAPHGDASSFRALLVRQVANPVEWIRSIETVVAAGVTHVLEIGSGKVLAGLVKRIAKGVKVHNVSDPAGVEAARAFLSEAGCSI